MDMPTLMAMLTATVVFGFALVIYYLHHITTQLTALGQILERADVHKALEPYAGLDD